MRIISSFLRLIKKSFHSHTGQIFFLVQLILLTIAFVKKGTILSEHFEYELLLYKIIGFINIPATLIFGLLFLPVILISLLLGFEETGLYVWLILIYLGWQIQSVISGYGIEQLVKKYLSKKQMK